MGIRLRPVEIVEVVTKIVSRCINIDSSETDCCVLFRLRSLSGFVAGLAVLWGVVYSAFFICMYSVHFALQQ